MDRQIIRIGIIIMMLLISGNGYADDIKVAGIEYCPYTCDRQKDGFDGFMIDIAKTVFEKAGHTYHVTMMPFARALQFVIDGEYDALAICNKADVPEGGLIFPDIPIAIVKNTFAVRKDETWKYRDVDSLKNIRVGSIIGYTWKEEALNEYMAITKPPAVQRVGGDDATEQNLRKLIANRIDAYLDDPLIISRTAQKMGIADKIKFEADVSPTPHFVGFTPGKEKSLKYAKILSDGMRELRQSGELAKILEKYGIEDWEK